MIDEHCAPLSLNARLVQGPSKSQNFIQPKSIARASSFLAGRKGKSPFRLALAGCLCVFALLFLAAPALSADVTLAWDPNSDVDLEGYGVYFRQGSASPPYELFGYVSLQELEDPANPAFTVTGLEMGATYYFAVTAYDTEGNESSYSTPVCAEIGDQIVPCAVSSSSETPVARPAAAGEAGADVLLKPHRVIKINHAS